MTEISSASDIGRKISVVASIVGGLSDISMGLLNDRFGRRFGALVPACGWIVMVLGLYVYGHQGFAGNMLGFPMFWVYLAFVIGNSALGVVGSLAPVLVPATAAAFGGQLAYGMLIAVPALIVFLTMTLMLPETRGRDLGLRSSTAIRRQPI